MFERKHLMGKAKPVSNRNLNHSIGITKTYNNLSSLLDTELPQMADNSADVKKHIVGLNPHEEAE
jgi:hypothetical protein